MAFDPDKDKVLKAWKCEETGLIISINQYDKGQPKLQIGPVSSHFQAFSTLSLSGSNAIYTSSTEKMIY